MNTMTWRRKEEGEGEALGIRRHTIWTQAHRLKCMDEDTQTHNMDAETQTQTHNAVTQTHNMAFF